MDCDFSVLGRLAVGTEKIEISINKDTCSLFFFIARTVTSQWVFFTMPWPYSWQPQRVAQ